jgi:hypothetical protein
VEAGFATAVNSNVVLSAAETRRLDFALQVSTVKQEIVVTSQAPMLQTATTAVQGSVATQTILELPLQNQNASAVIMLLPGMTNMNNFFGQIIGNLEAGGVSPSANGLRDSSGGYTADGANINVGFYNYPAFNPVEDAVQEVSVQTGNYSAEYGVYGGGLWWSPRQLHSQVGHQLFPRRCVGIRREQRPGCAQLL